MYSSIVTGNVTFFNGFNSTPIRYVTVSMLKISKTVSLATVPSYIFITLNSEF